jgi:hypothetical protein
MLPPVTSDTGQSAAADFARRFAEFWTAPEPQRLEFTLSGSAGGAPISWHAVDRFVLGDDGLAGERISYFDSAPIALTVARRPRAWPSFGRVQLRRLRR